MVVGRGWRILAVAVLGAGEGVAVGEVLPLRGVGPDGGWVALGRVVVGVALHSSNPLRT